jgi:hypothetical protein
MAEPLVDQVIRKIDQAAELYHRLIILVAPAGSGKTLTLREVCQRTGALLINLNLELSRRMLDLTERQRALQLPRLLSEIVDSSYGNMILLDNIEILFEVSLKQDPLRLLQGLSRNKTLIAAWNGTINMGQLIYAEPDHPEYKRYPVRDFLVITPEIN